jgi:hypothetical protein
VAPNPTKAVPLPPRPTPPTFPLSIRSKSWRSRLQSWQHPPQNLTSSHEISHPQEWSSELDFESSSQSVWTVPHPVLQPVLQPVLHFFSSSHELLFESSSHPLLLLPTCLTCLEPTFFAAGLFDSDLPFGLVACDFEFCLAPPTFLPF